MENIDQRLCCICIQSDTNLKQLSEQDYSVIIRDKLRFCVPNQKWDDQLRICIVCRTQLDITYQFLTKCMESCKQREILNEIDKGPFHCSICNETYAIEKEFNVHNMQRHSVVTDIKIEEIDTEGPEVEKQVERATKSPKKNVRRRYFCTRCVKPFFSMNLYKKHVEQHLNRYKCRPCDVGFEQLAQFLEHKKWHINIAIKSCLTCKNKYQGEYCNYCPVQTLLYICPECGLSFTNQSACNQHLKRTHIMTL